MRVNNQVWSALTIFGGKDHRNIFIAHIENFMLGCEHNTDNSIIYFDLATGVAGSIWIKRPRK